MRGMSTAERGRDRALRRDERIRTQLGDEIRIARLAAGASQATVARAAQISQAEVSRIDAGRLSGLPIKTAVVLADAVRLDVSFKAYPGRQPTRDAAHAKKLAAFLAHVAKPLRFATEVALPKREGVAEQRAWDAMIFGTDGETGVELEMRLYDLQSQTRRIHLKWRDSGAERPLLLINDTAVNRCVLRTYPEYLVDLPRLKTSTMYATLDGGARPQSGFALV
jgi:transcriptional regulator with XRE-family HTH domain